MTFDFRDHNTLKVAIISDTHAVLDERVAAVVRNADIALHAGDICDATVLEHMQPKLGQVIAVAGNNDFAAVWPEVQKTVVDALPQSVDIKLPGGMLSMEHGHLHGAHQPCHDSLREMHNMARVIVYGHTHKQVCDDEQLPWVINPGAAGATRTRGGPSCLILNTFQDKEWQIEALRFPDNDA